MEKLEDLRNTIVLSVCGNKLIGTLSLSRPKDWSGRSHLNVSFLSIKPDINVDYYILWLWISLCILLCISSLPFLQKQDPWFLTLPHSFLWWQRKRLCSGLAELIDLINANSLMFSFLLFWCMQSKISSCMWAFNAAPWQIVHYTKVLCVAVSTVQLYQPLLFKNVIGCLWKSVNGRRNSRSGIRQAQNLIQFLCMTGMNGMFCKLSMKLLLIMYISVFSSVS